MQESIDIIQALQDYPVGAAAGCDLLLFSDPSAIKIKIKIKIKRSQASPAPTSARILVPERGVWQPSIPPDQPVTERIAAISARS
ncbi:hypothetical protein [Pseudomonas sp. S2_A02]|jgi:hypothetical protein